MFSVAGEAITIALAAIPAIVKINLHSSNAALSPVLAVCIALAAEVAIRFSHPQDAAAVAATSPEQSDDGEAGGASATAHRSGAVASSPSLHRRPGGPIDGVASATADASDGSDAGLDWGEGRHPARLPELSLEPPPKRRDSIAPTTAPPATRSTKNGHSVRHRAEERRDTTSNNSGRHVTNTNTNNGSSSNNSSSGSLKAAAAAATSSSTSSVPRSSPATPTTPPSAPAPAKRQRHGYRKGGEVLYIAEGVAQAAMGLVRDPVRGAQADGARGLVRGLGSGVFGVVLKPAKGVAKAGVNAYTGVRIGVSKAGRVVVGGSRNGNMSTGSSSASKVSGNHFVEHVCVWMCLSGCVSFCPPIHPVMEQRSGKKRDGCITCILVSTL